MASCTVIKTGATVSKTASERVEELKNKINNIQVPIIAKVGDIAFYDSEKDKIIIVDFDKWNGNTDNYPSSRYTPIGVVAIPSLHDVYGTGECGVVSLKYMNYTTPDEGSNSYQNIYWGNSTQIGKLYTKIVTHGNFGDELSVNAVGLSSNSLMPSDQFVENEDFQNAPYSPTDPDARYYYDAKEVGGVGANPSPYIENEGKNSVYSQVTEPSSEENGFSDFDGLNKTQAILDAVTVSNWKTITSISNSTSAGNFPAACCCWRFSTKGTKQGDWYLPAIGEVGYIWVRVKKINERISALINTYGNDIGGTIDISRYLWSSTEYSASGAWMVGNDGYVGSYGKGGNYFVRAVLRLSGSLS